jgi:hypothetical protein
VAEVIDARDLGLSGMGGVRRRLGFEREWDFETMMYGLYVLGKIIMHTWEYLTGGGLLKR